MSISAAKFGIVGSLVFLAFLCAAAQAVEAPYTVGWSAQLGSAADDQAHAVGVDGAGNVYVAGYTKGEMGQGPNGGGYDAFVAKYSAARVLQWTSQVGSTSDDCARGLAVDAAGNVYVTGYTYGNLAGRVGNYDAFLAKFDTNGANQWTQQLGTTAADMAYGITLDAAGGVYLTGDTKGNLSGTSAGSNDAHLIKYDADGAWQWSRQLGGTLADYSYAAAAFGSGIFIAGYTAGTLPGQTSLGNYDAYVARYDADGNLAWTRQLGTASSERGYALAADADGGLYLAGQTDGAMDGINAGDYDIYLTRMDANGSTLWTRQTGTALWDRAMGVATDFAGGVYLTGETNGSLAADSAGYADMILLKYSGAGDPLWNVQLGSPGQDEGHAIAADSAGRVYVAGLTLGDLAGTGAFGSIDAVLVQLVPEPGCLALLVVVIGFARRRRSR